VDLCIIPEILNPKTTRTHHLPTKTHKRLMSDLHMIQVKCSCTDILYITILIMFNITCLLLPNSHSEKSDSIRLEAI
jgi:hypothetical protein